MSRNQDARPFVDLIKDATEFKTKFDDDITKCILYLDKKITALIRDPDSLGNFKRGANSNPVVEFSKAKYEIFVGARSLMNEMEKEWHKYISEMKKLFVENVEIFLAGTKLEVKLPTSEFQSSPSFKKSPRKQEQPSLTSSLYPIINSFAKNMAALSPLRGKDSTPQKRSPKKSSDADFQVSSSEETSTSEEDSTSKGRKSFQINKSMKPTVRISKKDESAAKASQRKSSSSDTDTDDSEYDPKNVRMTPTSKSRSPKEKSNSTAARSRSRSSSAKRGTSKELSSLSDSPGFVSSKSRSGHRSSHSKTKLAISQQVAFETDEVTVFNKSQSSSGERKKEAKLNTSRSSSGHRGSNEEAKLNTSRSSSGHRGSNEEAKLNRSVSGKQRTSSSSKSPVLSGELKKLSNSPGFEANLLKFGQSSRHSAGRRSASSSAERSKRKVDTIELTDSPDSDKEVKKGHQSRKSVKTPKQRNAKVGQPKKAEEKKETETDTDTSTSRRTGSGRESQRAAKNTTAEQHKKSEEKKEADTSITRKAGRGRESQQTVKNSIDEQRKKDEDADESETENEESNFKTPSKGRKGKKLVKSAKKETKEIRETSPVKAVVKAAKNQAKSDKVESSDSEESEAGDDPVPEPKTKGKPPARGSKVESRTPARASRKSVKANMPQSESRHSSPKKSPHSTKQAASTTGKPKTMSTESEISEAEENKVSSRRKNKKLAVKDKYSDTSVTSKTPGRASRRAAAEDISNAAPTPKKGNLICGTESAESGTPRSPKKVTFTKEDVELDDFELSPVKISTPAARRKTLLPDLNDLTDINPGSSSRAKGKRKTISGVSDLNAVTPPKRLKVSRRGKNVSPSQDEDADDNLLEDDDNYSHWIPLKSVDAKIPARPAIYEVKVSRAKKSAFIGSCDSLRNKLTLYKLRQKSGHKHLDQFIDRNMNDIQIRYKEVSSATDAKTEVKNRINSFVAQYKTTPAYN